VEVLIRSFSFTSNRIQFVNEDDCRGLFPSCSKQFSDTPSSNSDVHCIDKLDQLGTRGKEGEVDLLSSNSLPLAEKKATPASPATALANKVFPVPGGPVKSTPLGNLPPNFSNFVGSFKNSTIS